jgi:hypothetical protein
MNPPFVFASITYETGTPLLMPKGQDNTPFLTVTSQCRLAFPHQPGGDGIHQFFLNLNLNPLQSGPHGGDDGMGWKCDFLSAPLPGAPGERHR